jgi:hypothetical protein
MMEAREYARAAYATLREKTCPGGAGHEGGPFPLLPGGQHTAADYCDACLIEALEAAFTAGKEERRS